MSDSKISNVMAFFKKYGWKGLIAVILCVAGVYLISSCSTIKAGYSRYRDIHQTDSTYIHYRPDGFATSETRVKSYKLVSQKVSHN